MKRSLRIILPVLIALVALGLATDAPSALAQNPSPGRVFLPMALRFTPDLRLTASADTYVFEADPGANRGSGLFLMAGYDGDEATMEGTLRTLIRFDLPAGVTVPAGQATLRIYYAGYSDFENQPRTVTAYGSTTAWDESNVSWANQPPRGAEGGSVVIRANAEWGYREIDVTSLVQNWLDSTTPNYGLYLIGPEVSGSDYSYRMFQSREAGHPPELIVKFK